MYVCIYINSIYNINNIKCIMFRKIKNYKNVNAPLSNIESIVLYNNIYVINN